MANVRDSDTSLWLHNKLGTSNDSWSGGSICSQLNADVLRKVKDCFVDLQTQVKLKLLLSFLHIPRKNVEEWRLELDEILEIASFDSEQWVCMLAEIFKTFPSTGSLNTDVLEPDENRRIFNDLLYDLKKSVHKHSGLNLLPAECLYLNKNALVTVVGQQPQPVKHFQLKRKPKSAALRAELLQKSMEATNNLKKSSVPTVPLRSRGMPRKMTDTTPLKGLPSRGPLSGFRSPAIVTPALSRPMARTPAGKKEGGVKLLDINEQPMGYAQARKRKRQQELEAAAKKIAEAQQVTTQPSTPQTPDYAAGLVLSSPATPAPVLTSQSSTSASSNLGTPTTSVPTPSQSIIVSTSPITSTSSASQTFVLQPTTTLTLQARAQTITPTNIQPTAVPSAGVNVIVQAPAAVASKGATTPEDTADAPPAAAAAAAAKKSLQLTREQMLEAHEMFKTANRVTRPEKALILGFMAGSRDNPCPHLGNIVTIKLSENQENVQQQDGSFLAMIVETHFQMNYNTGEWKRIKKFRPTEASS